MQGNTLYPLNMLKNKHPDVYQEQMIKYIGREQVTRQKIPAFNCLWNDVLHFSAVDPREIKQALVEAGRSLDFTMRYYQIDPNLLESTKTIVYLYHHVDSKNQKPGKDFVPYNPKRVAQYSSIPEETKQYYKETVDSGDQPLLYHKIPHILYKGTLNTTNLPIISV